MIGTAEPAGLSPPQRGRWRREREFGKWKRGTSDIQQLLGNEREMWGIAALQSEDGINRYHTAHVSDATVGMGEK